MFGFFKTVAKNKKARGIAAGYVQKGGTGALAKVFAGAGHNAKQQKKKQPGR